MDSRQIELGIRECELLTDLSCIDSINGHITTIHMSLNDIATPLGSERYEKIIDAIYEMQRHLDATEGEIYKELDELPDKIVW
jgi:hypothetical protein